LEGFGTNPWRTLWEAAKIMLIVQICQTVKLFLFNFIEKCVLCQQELDEAAQQRLTTFNQFVLNDVSTQLNAINLTIQQKHNLYNSLVIPPIENLTELEQFIPDFRTNYTIF
jgi:hypothetical protein